MNGMQQNVDNQQSRAFTTMSTATSGKQIIQAPQLGQTIQLTQTFSQNDTSLASAATNPGVLTLAATSSNSNLVVNRNARVVSNIPTIPLTTTTKPMMRPPTAYTVLRTVGSPVKTQGSPNKYKHLLSPVKSIVPNNTAQSFTLVNNDKPATSSNPTKITLRSPSKYLIAPNRTTVANNVGSTNTSTIVPGISNIQQMGTSNKVQYVRLVRTTQSDGNVSQPASISPAVAKPPMIKTEPGTQAVQITIPPNYNPPKPQQRVLLPATAKQIRPAPPGMVLSGLPPGTTFVQSANNGLALCFKPNVTVAPGTTIQTPQPIASTGRFVRTQSTTTTVAKQPPPTKPANNGPLIADGNSSRPRKPCNCTKSQCLKLYCDCFANGEFCSNCNCHNCANNLEHESDRARAIKSCLDRNPYAFHPKIGKGRGGVGERRHQKGCNCKRSGCLKNYCECYEAKILCSSSCKCLGCKNFEESDENKTLMHLADAANLREQQQSAANSRIPQQVMELPTRRPPQIFGERSPCTFITHEVAEATCSCLIAQAEEAERTQQLETTTERLILEEFGRCLMQVIQSANRTRAGSPMEEDPPTDLHFGI